MSSSTGPSITLVDVRLIWPDGATELAGVTATFGAGRTGLVGLNGSGKSTLLRLIAGELRPSGPSRWFLDRALADTTASLTSCSPHSRPVKDRA